MACSISEAMAHGLPVIALDHQGARDLVSEEAGLRVVVSTVRETRRDIALAIEKLAGSAELRETLGSQAWRRATAFTLSRRIDEIEGIYSRMADTEKHA